MKSPAVSMPDLAHYIPRISTNSDLNFANFLAALLEEYLYHP